MSSEQSNYQQWLRDRASHCIAEGHADPTNLRELLILTTNKTTFGIVNGYFNKHQNDSALLANLVKIALEVEDAGDASWAATNIIAGFPAIMLVQHISELEILSNSDWEYLRVPAIKALAKNVNSDVILDSTNRPSFRILEIQSACGTQD
jgi:hypothetical protein